MMSFRLGLIILVKCVENILYEPAEVTGAFQYGDLKLVLWRWYLRADYRNAALSVAEGTKSKACLLTAEHGYSDVKLYLMF